jgi:hypothetical protein
VSATLLPNAGPAEHARIVTQWRTVSEGQPPIWTGSTRARPPARVSYAKAPYLLHRLEERVRPEVMESFLLQFFTTSARTTPALLELLREVAGETDARWFATELSR